MSAGDRVNPTAQQNFFICGKANRSLNVAFIFELRAISTITTLGERRYYKPQPHLGKVPYHLKSLTDTKLLAAGPLHGLPSYFPLKTLNKAGARSGVVATGVKASTRRWDCIRTNLDVYKVAEAEFLFVW